MSPRGQHTRRAAAAALLLAACGHEETKHTPAHHAAAGKAPPAVPTLAVAPKPPPVGLIIEEDSTEISTMTLTKAGATTSLREEEHEVTRSEVVAVDGGAITRVKIHYETASTERVEDGKSTVEHSPLEGHDYEVWVDAGKLEAARADGAKVGDAEAEALAREHGDLGQVPPLVRIITGRTWKQGERVDLAAADLAGLTQDPAMTLTGGSFTWRGAGGGAAVFVDQVSFVEDDARGKIETSRNGEVQLEVGTVRPTVITSLATSHGELRGALAGTTIDGSTEAHASYHYR